MQTKRQNQAAEHPSTNLNYRNFLTLEMNLLTLALRQYSVMQFRYKCNPDQLIPQTGVAQCVGLVLPCATWRRRRPVLGGAALASASSSRVQFGGSGAVLSNTRPEAMDVRPAAPAAERPGATEARLAAPGSGGECPGEMEARLAAPGS